MRILCVEVWHCITIGYIQQTFLWAQKKFAVGLDLIKLHWNLQKLVLLMEEIKLEIDETWVPNFIIQELGEDSEILHMNLCRMLGFSNQRGTQCFTWHVPFTSMQSKVATSIYTMAVLSRSPAPQNHRNTDTQNECMETTYISSLLCKLSNRFMHLLWCVRCILKNQMESNFFGSYLRWRQKPCNQLTHRAGAWVCVWLPGMENPPKKIIEAHFRFDPRSCLFGWNIPM